MNINLRNDNKIQIRRRCAISYSGLKHFIDGDRFFNGSNWFTLRFVDSHHKYKVAILVRDDNIVFQAKNGVPLILWNKIKQICFIDPLVDSAIQSYHFKKEDSDILSQMARKKFKVFIHTKDKYRIYQTYHKYINLGEENEESNNKNVKEEESDFPF
jgi:hypothetical protein